MKIRWISMMAAATLLFAGCGGGDDGDGGGGTVGGANSAVAEAAVDEMVASGMARDDAECYVNALLEEFGADELVAIGRGAEVSPEAALRAFEIFDECGVDVGSFGEDDLGEMPTDFRELAMPRAQVDGPYTYGDDAAMDALWDACEAGSGAACDELFFESPAGSEYEAFGNTCGNRMELQFMCTSLDE